MSTEATEAAEATEGAAATTGAGAGAGTGQELGPRPDDLPEFGPGGGPTTWVAYLQQMLNYTFQSQLCTEDGVYGDDTIALVRRFRQEQGLDVTDRVDKKFWKALGVADEAAEWDKKKKAEDERKAKAEEAKKKQEAAKAQGKGSTAKAGAGQAEAGHAAGQAGAEHGAADHGQETSESEAEPYSHRYSVSPVYADNDAYGAAALVAVINASGAHNFLDIAAMCQHAEIDPQEVRSAQEASSVGKDKFGLSEVYCWTGYAPSWAEVLAAHGPLWTPDPTGNNAIVVAGIEGSGENVTIDVLDPSDGTNGQMSFEEFTSKYGFGEQSQGALLAAW